MGNSEKQGCHEQYNIQVGSCTPMIINIDDSSDDDSDENDIDDDEVCNHNTPFDSSIIQHYS